MGWSQDVAGLKASRTARVRKSPCLVVNDTGTFFHSNANDQWTAIPGSATDVGVGGNGDV